jgi:DNA-binding NarL/FixJ family response regulator
MDQAADVGVLIVDDHPLIRRMLAKLFDATDGLITIATCPTVAQALDVAALTRPDVVLMDLNLGHKVDGVAGTQALHRAHPDTHVLILTGNADTPRHHSAIRAGACRVLTKDIHPANLIASVRRCGATRRHPF